MNHAASCSFYQTKCCARSRLINIKWKQSIRFLQKILTMFSSLLLYLADKILLSQLLLYFSVTDVKFLLSHKLSALPSKWQNYFFFYCVQNIFIFSNINRVLLYFVMSMNFFLIRLENSMIWNYIREIVGPKLDLV